MCYQSVVFPCLFAFSWLATAAPIDASAPPVARILPAPGGVVLTWGAGKSPVLRGKGDAARVRVETADDATPRWALVRWPQVTGGSKLWAFVQDPSGSLRLAWEGDDGPLDADGEANARVTVAKAGLVRSFTASWLRRCDVEAPVWRIEDFDTSKRAFVPRFAPPWLGSGATSVAASAVAPMLAGQPWPPVRQHAFAFTAASSAAAQTARALPSAGVLDDGNVATAWRAWNKGGGFAFATARAASELALTGVALTKADGTVWPQTLQVTASDATRLNVSVPSDAAATIWVALPEPITTSCVTIDVNAGPAAEPLALAEVQFVTTLDGTSAVDHVASRILSGVGCGAVLPSLANVEPAALATRLANQLASASQAGQACAWEALAKLPPAAVPPLQTWLLPSLPAVLSAPPSVLKPQTLAFWVGRGGPTMSKALAQIVQDATQTAGTRETAARLLASHEETLQLLLDQVGTTEGDTNALVRRVLLQSRVFTMAAIDRLLPASRAQWSQQPQHHAELLWLGTQLRWQQQEPAWLNQAASCAEDALTPFGLRARCVQALGPSLTFQARLIRIAMGDDDPVIRHLAFEALVAKQHVKWTPPLQTALEQGLRDRDPRVRQTVARGFARSPGANRSASTLSKAYASERWPFAKAALVEAIAAACVAPQILMAALAQDDVSLDGKIAALEGLAACKFGQARPEALNALKRQVAPVPLREAAAKVLMAVGEKEDANTLVRVLRQATSAAATDPSLDDVAAATLETLVPLDPSQATIAALELVNQPRPRLRRSGMAALGKLCGPAALAAIDAQLASNDAWVANAARQSKAQCEARAKSP